MKFIFDTKYSETELEFLSRHNCKMISEIKLSKWIYQNMKYRAECSNTVVSILGKSSMMRVINLYGPF